MSLVSTKPQECCQVGDFFGIGLNNYAEFCRQRLVRATNITDMELAYEAGKEFANEWMGDGHRLKIVMQVWTDKRAAVSNVKHRLNIIKMLCFFSVCILRRV